MRELLNV